MRLPARNMVVDAEGNRYQLTGHEFDGETNYGYHGARYYNQELGRYMNVDRFAEKEFDQSPYVYAGNQVVNAVDVNGDSIVIDDKGYLLRADRDADGNLVDYFVFNKNDDGSLNRIGTLTEQVSTEGWFANLLVDNGIAAASMIPNAFEFADAVQTWGKWDYKNLNRHNSGIGKDQKYAHILGLAFSINGEGLDTEFMFAGKEYRSEDLNNIHFGFVSNAFGFPETFALKKAGDKEMEKAAGQGEEVPESWRPTASLPLPVYPNEVRLPPYGDRPIDHKMIRIGMKLYNELVK